MKGFLERIYKRSNGIGGDYMLVLGRKPGEYIMIGENIKIKVVKSEDGNLRLAIEAPKDLSIVRGELNERQNSKVAMDSQ